MDKIGRYRIVGKLGSGGFGTVYKANDPGMGRVVAIKVLNAQDDAGLVKRFKAEARMAAKLHHPNIVTVFDFGEENGKLYLVMEYLDGVTLGDLVAGENQFSTVEKLQILCDAAQGLKAAHEQGIVHRDVKPSNIMRVADGSVKIMDFGISRAMASVDTRLTQAGFMMGTPAYMAPEQFNEGVTDVLSDVWAYGVVLYEFLTGTNPFLAPTPEQVIYRLTMVEPPALSRSLTGLPERLEGVAKRLLCKERNRRYQTMEDVCFDLEALLLEIRQPEIDGLIASTDELIRGVHLDEALDKVRRVLELDRANAWARKRRGDIQEMVRVRSVQARVQELLDQAGAQALAGNDAARDARLEEALKLDPTNGEVRRRIDEIQVARALAKRSANLLSNTRDELDRALEFATQAAESDPGNADARKLVDAIRLALQGRDLESRDNELDTSIVKPTQEPTEEVTRSTKTPPAGHAAIPRIDTSSSRGLSGPTLPSFAATSMDFSKTRALKTAAIVMRVVLGLIFIYVGYVRVRHPWQHFAVSILYYHVVPIWAATFLARTLPAFEILLGATLVAGRLPRVSGTIGSALLLVSFGLMARALAQRKGIPFEPDEVISWKTLVREASMLAGALFVTVIAFRNRRSTL
jgi:predicted Ser/Thr protein kinase